MSQLSTRLRVLISDIRLACGRLRVMAPTSDLSARAAYLYVALFVPGLALVVWSNADWNAITGDTLLLVSSFESLERFSSIFSLANSNPLQGLFDVFTSGLRLDTLPNLIGRALFGPGMDVTFFHYFNGVFLAAALIFMARTFGFGWNVSLLGGCLLPLLILPTFGLFSLVEHIYLLWPILYYAVACTILVMTLYWRTDGNSRAKWLALTGINAIIVLHLSVIQPLFMTLIAPAFLALGIGALFASRSRVEVFAKLLSAAAIFIVLLATGIFHYTYALGANTAHHVFFVELSSFMLFGDPSWSTFWEDTRRVFVNPFDYVWPGRNSIDGLMAPIGQLGAALLVLFGPTRNTRIFGWCVILWSILTAITIGILHFFYFYAEMMYNGPDPRHFVRILWPFYILCAAYAVILAADLVVAALSCLWKSATRTGPCIYHLLIASVIAGPPAFIGIRHLILTVSPTSVVSNQIFPTPLPTYTLRSNKVVDLLQKEIGIGIGREFRGSALTMPTEYHKDLNPYGIWRRETTFTYSRAYFGNDFGGYGLRDHNIPTLDQFSHNITPQFYIVTRELMSRVEVDKFDRHFAAVTRINERILALLGARFLVADYDLPVGRQVLSWPLPEPGRGHMAALKLQKSPMRVFEIEHPNVGNYSPTEVIVARSARSTIQYMADPSFDGRKSLITADLPATEKLVPASGARMVVQEGGVRLEATSSGTSALVLPVQFSNCWQIVSGTKARLLRANLLQLGVLFSGELKIELRQIFGPFGHSGCRIEDARDTEKLRMVDALGAVADLDKEQGDGVNLIAQAAKLESIFPSSSIARLTAQLDPAGGPRVYTLTAKGGRSEHYVGASMPEIEPGTYTLSMQVRADTDPAMALQLQDGQNGVLVRYLLPHRLFWISQLGKSDKLDAGIVSLDDQWVRVSLTATLQKKGAVIILQLANRGGSRNFNPGGERIIFRNLKLERGEIPTGGP